MPDENSFSEIEGMLDERGFRRILRRTSTALVLALGVPLIILLGLVFFLLNSARWVDHTDRVISQANSIEKLLVTMQTSFRGYRLSNDEKYLELYTTSHTAVLHQWDALTQLVSDNGEQTSVLVKARAEAAEWIRFVDQQIERARTGASPPGDASFLSVGGPMFDRITRQLDDFILHEERQRTTRLERLNVVTLALLGTMGLTALIGIPALSFWVQRLLKRVTDSYRASTTRAHLRAAELYVTLNSIGDAVIATDLQGRISFLNLVAEKLTGWKNAEARHRPLGEVFDIYNERTGAKAENPVDRVLRENIVVGLANHTVLRSRKGERIPIEDSAAPIREEDGKMQGVILVFHDVTDRRMGEQRLQASERRFRFLNELGEETRALIDPEQIMAVTTRMVGEHMNVSRCAYADVEPDGEKFTIRRDYVNDCASTAGVYQLSVFGEYAAGAMREGRTLVLRDVDAELEGSALDAFHQIGIQAIICCPLVKEGKLCAMMAVHQIAARTWTEAEITLVEEVVERCWAIIERARAETVTRERGRFAELRAEIASQLDLGRPLEHSLQRSCELIVEHLNAGFARVWIVPDEEAVLELRASAGSFPELDGPHARVPIGELAVGRIAATGEPYLTNDVPHDPYISQKGGEREGIKGYAGYPLLVEGRVLGVLAVFSPEPLSEAVLADLAPLADTLARHIDRKRADSALRVAKEQAETASRAKDSFLAALSHELRTPLTPVLMTATTLRDDPRLPEDAREALGMMERNIALEARLIDDLLDLTAIVRGKMQLRPLTCDAHSLIGLAIEIVREDAKAKEIKLERDFQARSSGLVADPARFQQLIWNLLRNAVKFTPRGGRVLIHTENEPGDRLKIEVRDTGIGIAPEATEKIFQPFEQAAFPKENRFGGLGLGLAIARAIVDLHGGQITARSDGANKGAIFTVDLPGATKAPADVEAPQEPEKPPITSLKETGPATRLLLVEDHEDSIKVLNRLLSLSGYRVTMARTVAEGLTAAKQDQFDLVISDLGLPDGTGNELMEKLHQEYGLQGIALSGYGMDEDIERSRRAGFTAHLVKPVDFAQLATTLKKLL